MYFFSSTIDFPRPDFIAGERASRAETTHRAERRRARAQRFARAIRGRAHDGGIRARGQLHLRGRSGSTLWRKANLWGRCVSDVLNGICARPMDLDTYIPGQQ